MKVPSRRVQAALEKEATVRLARFERLEAWNGLVPGDPVRIAGHRGGTWRFRAFVTNTSNGASWIEVSEVLGTRRRSKAAGDEGEADRAGTSTGSVSRTRSFRPELVTPLRKARRRRRSSPSKVPAVAGPAVQAALFEPAAEAEGARD